MSAAEIPKPIHETPHLGGVHSDAAQLPEQARLSYDELLAGFDALTAKTVELEDQLLDAQNENDELKNENEELKQKLYYDSLTGALSQEGLEHELETNSTQPIAIVKIDVTNFKAVNDEHGHGGGDAVLKDVHSILRRSIRPGDLIARLNSAGDEFAVVLFDDSTENEVADATSTPEVDRRDNKDETTAEELIDIVGSRLEKETAEYIEDSPVLKDYNFDIAAGSTPWDPTKSLENNLDKAGIKLKQHKAEQHARGHYDRRSRTMTSSGS